MLRPQANIVLAEIAGIVFELGSEDVVADSIPEHIRIVFGLHACTQ